MNVSTPVVDITPYLEGGPESETVCKQVAAALAEYGQVIFRDTRVDYDAGHRLLCGMQTFFAKPDPIKRRYQMKHCAHQTGFTPADQELPGAANGEKDAIIAAFAPEHRPMPVVGRDKKERYMFPVGPRLDATVYGYEEFNECPTVIPHDQPELFALSQSVGGDMLRATFTLLEMAAIGWGEPRDFFTKRMQFGPHFLAPTGSDLIANPKPGTVLAGFHNDMSLGTTMLKATTSGLFCWTRGGIRYAVRVPARHLFFQAGRQMQWLTGGVANRVFHEVVVVEENLPLIEQAIAKGEPCIRAAAPLFAHCNTNETIAPDGHFATPEAIAEFPPYIQGEKSRGSLIGRGLHWMT